MPRYFIDVELGSTIARDEDGAVYADLGDARTETLAALADLAKTKVADCADRDFVGSVRNDRGQLVFKAVLSMTVKTQLNSGL